MDFHVNWLALLIGMAIGFVGLYGLRTWLRRLWQQSLRRGMHDAMMIAGGPPPAMPPGMSRRPYPSTEIQAWEGIIESNRELSESIQQVGKVLRAHIEQTDPTYIEGVGKVLLPEPTYSDWLKQISEIPATASTRLAYDEWRERNTPTYEEWLATVYPKMKLADEIASGLAAADRDPSSTAHSEASPTLPPDAHNAHTESAADPASAVPLVKPRDP